MKIPEDLILKALKGILEMLKIEKTISKKPQMIRKEIGIENMGKLIILNPFKKNF